MTESSVVVCFKKTYVIPCSTGVTEENFGHQAHQFEAFCLLPGPTQTPVLLCSGLKQEEHVVAEGPLLDRQPGPRLVGLWDLQQHADVVAEVGELLLEVDHCEE